jgi:hypothetical protein
MKKIFYFFLLSLFGQIMFAQTDTSFFPLHVGNYWRLSNNQEHFEWKIIGDTVFKNRGKYFVLNAGGGIEYLRKAENGDIIIYSPACDTEYVKYPFSLYTGTIPGNYLIRVPYKGFSKEGCSINVPWFEVIISAQNKFILSELCCDWYFTKGIGLSGYRPCLDSYSLESYYVHNGSLSVSSGSVVVDKYVLSQNYPNPFNPSTKIAYTLPEEGFVSLKVYDMLGREVKVLVKEFKKSGTYEIEFDAGDLSSGLYLYKLNCNNFTDSKKMNLLK